MKRIVQNYGILGLSLAVLFASGLVIGRLTAPRPAALPGPVAEASADPEAWAEAASHGLVKSLQLDDAQLHEVRLQLEPVAAAIYADRERTLFQMHLRLLGLHDSLAEEGSLNETQLKRLAASRSKLKDLIIRKFPLRVRQNPTLAIGSESE